MELPKVTPETIREVMDFIQGQNDRGEAFNLDEMAKDQESLAMLMVGVRDGFPSPKSFMTGVVMTYLMLKKQAEKAG